MKHDVLAALGAALALLSGIAAAQTVAVTVDNFRRAETDAYFDIFTKRAGGLGKIYHYRDLPPVDGPGVRPNRDMLYSEVVFDLDAGPVTITLPNAGKRFMSMIVIDQDHYAQAVYYGGGSRMLSRGQIGTRYVFVAVRTRVDAADAKDMERVHALQDAIRIAQPGGPGRFDMPDWDSTSQKKVRDALRALSDTLPDLRRAGGRKNDVEPLRHLIGTASAWGLSPDKDAIYLGVVPPKNDGSVVHKLAVRDVPVDGFWSISVYDAAGHFAKNPYDAYTLNSVTAKKAADGTVAVQFGGCDGKIANCLPITPGWNYMVRLYRPRPDVLSGRWTFPAAAPQ